MPYGTTGNRTTGREPRRKNHGERTNALRHYGERNQRERSYGPTPPIIPLAPAFTLSTSRQSWIYRHNGALLAVPVLDSALVAVIAHAPRFAGLCGPLQAGFRLPWTFSHPYSFWRLEAGTPGELATENGEIDAYLYSSRTPMPQAARWPSMVSRISAFMWPSSPRK